MRSTSTTHVCARPSVTVPVKTYWARSNPALGEPRSHEQACAAPPPSRQAPSNARKQASGFIAPPHVQGSYIEAGRCIPTAPKVVSMLKLFGQARSRASRSLWMLEEIGIPYEHVPVRPYTESRAADYLRLNPNGHIPTLDDDGLVLWESLAINLYLAERYAVAPLWPAGAQDHGRIYQWSLW